MSRRVKRWRPPLQEIELWDGRKAFGWYCDGFPAFPYKSAPSGLVTRRQLRAKGLCPGGREPYAVMVWRRGKRWAHLFIEKYAMKKRIPTPAQNTALAKAMLARRICRAGCGRDVGYCVPRSTGKCWDCLEAEVDAAEAAEKAADAAALAAEAVAA